MFTIFSYLVGIASGIALSYWWSHEVNPTAAQQNLDAIKTKVEATVGTVVTDAETAVKDEAAKVL